MFEVYMSCKNNANAENNQLWHILARFAQECLLIKKIRLLPDWLGDYVKYDNPKALPAIFSDYTTLSP